ncbi:DUF2846 domain-containing protein [Aliarcobacter butzleri]|uniref:DUF2846 domain-containing protein n=1 Tax=Aliarcobacter butzleri TaxID=28197 RepID=UPI00263F139D|nr:DUF2846 domain-containing protein [Aliarcobacter butzleri]MDN5092993.1 DUF2846 domain-containing protein [Aliarcobacter butzleri]
MKKLVFLSIVTFTILFSGCASVKMALPEESNQAKQFNQVENGKAGIYIYRDSTLGGALKKKVYIDDKCIGETAPNVFFYEQVEGNKEHKISTQSEFSNNDLLLKTQSGKNYFIRQYIKMGVFVGGANLELIDEDKAKESISKLDMALKGICDK